MIAIVRAIFSAMVRLIAARNLASDRFGTVAAVLGVALGVATVNVVVILDVNTQKVEAARWTHDPSVAKAPDTIAIRGVKQGGAPVEARSAKTETHEDYEVMRSAIRLGSLSAFLVGALIVFFTFGVVVDKRKREVALLRSLGVGRSEAAAIFVYEAVVVGAAGALVGFLASVPMAAMAAMAGITTTGRLRIPLRTLEIPWGSMALVAAIGAVTALLGVLRPARDVLRLSVAETLRPRFMEREGPRATARRARSVTLLVLPFMSLVYGLMRPFFKSALPSLTFFVIEAGLVCLAFLATLALVPDLVQRAGGLLLRLVPRLPPAERLLTLRRVELTGHELSWSVSGVMLVFSLLLALHIATYALKREVVRWADKAIAGDVFVTPAVQGLRADDALETLPKDAVAVRYSTKTPWPNTVYAVASGELVPFAKARKRADLVRIAERMGQGKVLLSTMMARRYRVKEGDSLVFSGRGGERTLEIIAVTDDIGFTLTSASYRNVKTYAVIDEADYPLIEPWTDPVGAVAVVADGRRLDVVRWMNGGWAHRRGIEWGMLFTSGAWYKGVRVRETNRDFLIFDLILALTSVLAAVGIANQMVLSVRGRKREIALYRVLGMTPREVRRLVLFEGAFIGLTGGLFAALLGVPLGYAAIGALRAVSAFEVEFHLPVTYVVAVVIGSVVVSLVSALIPASRAVEMGAAESIHYE